MPALTVCDSPKGLPIATTQSPTSIASESPKGSAGTFFVSIRTTAMSVAGSVPTTLPGNSRSSESLTAMVWAPSTTWLFVRTIPLLSMTKPLPRPCVWRRRRRCVKGETSTCSPTVVIVTTLASAPCTIGEKVLGSPCPKTGPAAGAAAAGLSPVAVSPAGNKVAPGGRLATGAGGSPKEKSCARSLQPVASRAAPTTIARAPDITASSTAPRNACGARREFA